MSTKVNEKHILRSRRYLLKAFNSLPEGSATEENVMTKAEHFLNQEANSAQKKVSV